MMHFYQIRIQSLIEKKKKILFENKIIFSRFQCGLCRRYQSNVDEFIKHITEKHRMDVCVFNILKNKIKIKNLL